MQDTTFSFDQFDFGTKLIRDLVNQDQNILPFAGKFYDVATISEIIGAKNFSADQRQTLVSALKKQNESIELSQRSQLNIDLLLEPKTFTITTGHQLNLLTGPLFSIYKIAQIISICDGLKKSHPQFNFVPVFWMASEDHDFEEINHIHLFGKKITWQNPDQKDVVAGRMKLETLFPILDEIESLYQNDELISKLKLLTQFYRDSANLAEATRKLINYLFRDFGLVILDGDDQKLKEKMQAVFLKEVKDELIFSNVSATNEKLEKSGYHNQVFARNCNLFFIHADGKRERIVKENNQFLFNGKTFSLTEMEDQIVNDASMFSPNALLRPVYQESVLPNLVYVGGGGEIAYWLQLKSAFDDLKLSFPLLRVRDSIVLMNEKQQAELNELGLSLVDLKEDVAVITKRITLQKSGDTLDMADAQAQLLKVKSIVSEKVIRVDKNLQTMVEAEFTRMMDALGKIESKLIKTENGKDEIVGKKITKLQHKIFPEKHLQERHDNFLPYYLSSPDFVKKVVSSIGFESSPKIRTLIV